MSPNIINGRPSIVALERARLAADKVSTPAGRTQGGWIRLARVGSRTGRDVKPYVIAVRARNHARVPVQIGCSCPDWMFRKLRSGETCKHQREFMAHIGGSAPNIELWIYKAGAAFLSVLHDKDINSHE